MNMPTEKKHIRQKLLTCISSLIMGGNNFFSGKVNGVKIFSQLYKPC